MKSETPIKGPETIETKIKGHAKAQNTDTVLYSIVRQLQNEPQRRGLRGCCGGRYRIERASVESKLNYSEVGQSKEGSDYSGDAEPASGQ